MEIGISISQTQDTRMLNAIGQSLKFDPIVFVLQVVLFIFLWAAMNAIFWKPILAHMAARDKTVNDKYGQRDSLQKEMEALRADYLARIAVVEAEARTHIQEAIKEAQHERERLITEAREHAEATLKQGIADMEREKSEALQTLQVRMVGIAVGVADTAMASTADKGALQTAIATRVANRAAEFTDAARN
jgi:F-type H+-transporting ATPase subunit b